MTAQRHKSYRLEKNKIGAGGQAEVFRATRKDTGETVALKRVFRLNNRAALGRLKREIDVQRNLDHPHIVPILDFNSDEGWFTMPIAEGDLLKVRDAGTEVNPFVVLEQVCDALDHAHKEGVVHRDINPKNILSYGADDWKISDWGLVKRPPGKTTQRRTKIGTSFGTAGFTAPEAEKNGHDVDARCDIFSLGRLAFWLVLNQWPTAGELPIDCLPVGWRELIYRSDRPNPIDRLQTVADFAAEVSLLRRVLDPTGDKHLGGLSWSSAVAFGALLRECIGGELKTTAPWTILLAVSGTDLRKHAKSHAADLGRVVEIIENRLADTTPTIEYPSAFEFIDLVLRAAQAEESYILLKCALETLTRVAMRRRDERGRRLLISIVNALMIGAEGPRRIANEMLAEVEGARGYLAGTD